MASQMRSATLPTPEDTENRRRFLNARGTLAQLLERRIVPIINENDTVATEEIRYGDNDRLAARVAQLVMADGLLLLSDVDGLYRTDPSRDASAEHIPEVRAIAPDTTTVLADPAALQHTPAARRSSRPVRSSAPSTHLPAVRATRYSARKARRPPCASSGSSVS